MWGRLALALVLASACTWDGGLGDARFADDVDDPPPWWDVAWSTRYRLTFTASADVPAGLLVVVPAREVDVGATDWDDVALAWYDGSSWQRRPFLAVRQADALGDALWVALPLALAAGGVEGGLWLHSGHPSPPEPISLDPAYELVEYFDGPTLNAARWTGAGDVSFVGGQLHLGPGARAESVRTFGPGYAVDVVVQNASGWPASRVGFDGATWTYADGALAPSVDAWSGATYEAATRRFELAVERTPSDDTFRADSAVHDTHAAADSSPRKVVLENTGAAAVDLVIPSLRVRATVATPPTGTLGTSETRP